MHYLECKAKLEAVIKVLNESITGYVTFEEDIEDLEAFILEIRYKENITYYGIPFTTSYILPPRRLFETIFDVYRILVQKELTKC